jgi:hypothetical protein
MRLPRMTTRRWIVVVAILAVGLKALSLLGPERLILLLCLAVFLKAIWYLLFQPVRLVLYAHCMAAGFTTAIRASTFMPTMIQAHLDILFEPLILNLAISTVVLPFVVVVALVKERAEFVDFCIYVGLSLLLSSFQFFAIIAMDDV